MGPFNSSYLSNTAIFHFHDYGGLSIGMSDFSVAYFDLQIKRANDLVLAYLKGNHPMLRSFSAPGLSS